MNMKKEDIIKYSVVILAVLNMIWLFGFEYRLPAKADRPKTEETAAIAGTTEEVAFAEEKEPEKQTEKASEEESEKEFDEKTDFDEETDKESEEEADSDEETDEESEEKTDSDEETDEEFKEETETDENVVYCRVTAPSSLNVREGPGTSYKVVTTAKRNETLVFLGVEDGWAHVRKDSGQEGYVSGSYIQIVEEQTE